MAKFEVGDTVQVKSDADAYGNIENGNFIGRTGLVTATNGSPEYPFQIEFCIGEPTEDICEWYNDAQLQLVNKENEMSDVQSDPNKALRELNLDADTRLLRDMDFESNEGSPSEKARVEMHRRIWADMRAEVATDLRTAITNEEADKKQV